MKVVGYLHDKMTVFDAATLATLTQGAVVIARRACCDAIKSPPSCNVNMPSYEQKEYRMRQISMPLLRRALTCPKCATRCDVMCGMPCGAELPYS